MPDSGRAVADAKRATKPPIQVESTTDVEEATERSPTGVDSTARQTALLGDPRVIARFSPAQRAALVQRLQHGYGNAEVARLVAQIQAPAPPRPVGEEAAPDAPPAAGPGMARLDSRPSVATAIAPLTTAPRAPVGPTTAETEAAEAEEATGAPVQRQVAASAAPPAPPPARSGLVQRSLADAVLEKVAGWAHDIPGYYLLTVILGKDPIDDKPVERNAVNLIHGVVSLIPGGDAIFKNLQESGAIDQAFQWLQDETTRLGLTWDGIKAVFKQAWDSLSWTDALEPSAAWDKIKGIFTPTVEKVKQFALDAGKKLFEVVFESALKLAGPLAGTIMAAIKKAGDVLDQIVKDPVGFLGNLLKAVKAGFDQFLANIETHLKKGLMTWLFGSLADAGIQLPESFDLKGILTLVLQILGLTWQNIRNKLVEKVGEPAVKAIENTVSFVKTLVTQGIGAAWKQILDWVTEAAGSLKDMVLGAIKDWVIGTIIKAAITKLATMFNPVGAIVQAIITIYNTIEFLIDKAKQIADLADAVIDSIATIAAGNISGAANFVEQSLAKAVPVAIGFLADLIGLGGISQKIKEIIDKVRSPIEKALDKLVGWVVDKAKAGLAWLKQKGQQAVGATKEKLGIGKPDDRAAGQPGGPAAAPAPVVAFAAGGEQHRIWTEDHGGVPVVMVASVPQGLETMLKTLEVQAQSQPDLLGKIQQVRAKAGTVTSDYMQTMNLVRANQAAAAQKQTVVVKTAEEEVAALLAEIMSALETPLNAKSLVIDSNTAIALLKRSAGLPLQAGEQALLKRIDSLKDAELRVADVTIGEVKGGVMNWKTLPLSIARGGQDYQDVLAELVKYNVGGGKGDNDRQIVADACFARSQPGVTPTFATHDKDIYNKLLAMTGVNPAKLGKTVPEAYSGGFTVTIKGWTLKVIPLPRQ